LAFKLADGFLHGPWFHATGLGEDLNWSRYLSGGPPGERGAELIGR